MLRISEHWEGSDLGRQRQGNEDSYFVRVPLFVVADGMGGAQAGEVASEMAVAAFERGLPSGSAAEGLVGMVEEANRSIHDRSRSDADYAGMGTTVTAAHVGEDEVTIAHVGDSRAYVLRDGELIRLTRDHSLVGELVARGKLTEEQAEAHPQRSVITRALGPEPRVQVDVDSFPARPEDVFLLCSDGLTSMVPEARVRAILEEAASLEAGGRELIAAANDAGGRDNITVILFRLEEVGARASGAEDETSEHRTPDAAPPASEDPGVHTATMAAVRPRASPVDAAGRAPEPAAPSRRRRRRVPPVLIVTVALLAIVAGGFWAATRAVFFIGTDPAHGNVIAIYQGLPYEGPFGIRLYGRRAMSGVTIDQVPAARRSTFTDHKLRSVDDAENLVNALEGGKLEP
jgi:serine/threonine protein phosphatase PrpC